MIRQLEAASFLETGARVGERGATGSCREKGRGGESDCGRSLVARFFRSQGAHYTRLLIRLPFPSISLLHLSSNQMLQRENVSNVTIDCFCADVREHTFKSLLCFTRDDGSKPAADLTPSLAPRFSISDRHMRPWITRLRTHTHAHAHTHTRRAHAAREPQPGNLTRQHTRAANRLFQVCVQTQKE